VEADSVLSRREATLRSAATTCLAGIALVQAIELPSLLVQGGQFAVLSMAAMALCIALGWALAAAPAGASRQLWGAVAVTGVVVLAGWAAPRAFPIPGLSHHQGHWAALPGVIPAALGAACLALAVAAVPPSRAAARGLLTAVAVLAAFGPGVGAMLVALGPGLSGGETVLAAGGHLHSHGSAEAAIVYQSLPGGRGGRYVYRAVAAPHQSAFGIAAMVAAALLFCYGAVGYLRRRSASASSAPVALPGLEKGLA
jgi:hypothetical protein